MLNNLIPENIVDFIWKKNFQLVHSATTTAMDGHTFGSQKATEGVYQVSLFTSIDRHLITNNESPFIILGWDAAPSGKAGIIAICSLSLCQTKTLSSIITFRPCNTCGYQKKPLTLIIHSA